MRARVVLPAVVIALLAGAALHHVLAGDDSSGEELDAGLGQGTALPDALSTCFAQGLSGMTTGSSPGEDGVRVSMQMPARRGRDQAGRTARPPDRAPGEQP